MVSKFFTKKKVFYLYLNLCIAVFISLSSYIHIPLNTVKDYIVYAVHFGLLQFTLFGFSFVLTLNKWLFRILFSLLFLFFSLISFWVYTLDISISVDLIQVSLESKPDIYVDVISLPFVLYLVITIIVICSLQKLYSKVKINRKLIFIGSLLSIAAIALFFTAEFKKHGIFKRRMPYVAYYETLKYINQKPLVIKEIKSNVYANNKINVVFVLGESVRAKNLQLNGYIRETTPLLSSRKNIVSFKNIYTSNTYTSKSVPQILTNDSVEADEEKKIEGVYSLYSVLNKANYNTFWIGNQTPELSYRDFILENKESELIDIEHSVLSYRKKLDGDLLEIFENKFTGNNSSFYTLHMIGSHWWYESRYPKNFQKFQPVITSKYIPSNSPEEMINSYDNTIVYLDYFLNHIISFLEAKEQQIVLIYLSDHGETLGENGKWLHAQNNESSKNPACLVWYSDEFEEHNSLKIKSLNNNTKDNITTDFLYHSVLDLIDIQKFNYQKDKSIFNSNK